MYNSQPDDSYYERRSQISTNTDHNRTVEDESLNHSASIDLFSDVRFNASKRHLSFLASYWDIQSFGICVAAANIFIAWGSGFSNGFWEFFFATTLSAFSFINLFLCIAEITSIVPFGGGTYALARVTTGPYIGFLVGCCESIGNIVMALVNMMPLGTTITYMFGGDPYYEPLYWFLIYVLVIAMEFAGRRFYFTFLRCVAFLSLAIIVLYLIVSFQSVKVSLYIPNINSSFGKRIDEFMPLLYPSGWWYLGVDILPLLSDEVKDAKVNTPRAILVTVATVTVLAFVCMIFAFCQYPSYQDDYSFLLQSLPLNSGFTNAFGISDQMATILSYPGLYISNALFIYGYGKQLSALANSRLFPACFGWTLTNSAIPYFALVVGSLFGYVVLVILNKGYGCDYDSDAITYLFNAALMGSYFTYEVMFASFIIFRYKYSTLTRSFINPLGIYGAVGGMIGFGFLYASVIGFEDDHYLTFYLFIGFIVLASLYYYFFAHYRQTFSEEEQTVMFRIYLMKENQRKFKARRFVKKPRDGARTTAIFTPQTSKTSALLSERTVTRESSRQLKKVYISSGENRDNNDSNLLGSEVNDSQYLKNMMIPLTSLRLLIYIRALEKMNKTVKKIGF